MVGASAIAMTPVMQHDLQLPAVQLPSAAAVDVALAGFDSPLSELFKTFGQVNTFIFGSGNTAGDFAPFISTPGGYGLIQTVYGFNSVGIVPQIINDHLPIISQLGKNGSAYLDSTFNAIYSVGYTLSEGVWNAVGQAASLNFPAAVNTILTAVQTAGQTALQAGNFVLNNVVAKASALISAVPTLANLLVNATIGQAQVLAGTVVKVAQNVMAGIQAGDIEATWNAAVDGLFGPTGIPGVINALTVGAGVQTGAVPPVTGVVPSIRGEIQAVVHGVATALATTAANPPVPPPAAARSAAPSAAALRVAAAEPAAADEGGSAATKDGSGDNSATSGDNASGGASESKGDTAKASANRGLRDSKRAAKASAGKSSD
ncbi:hypothetical protein B1R94_07470 [Mycolicibacterium litorale]|nr:hypothetical protein B1R94_07470 [Mycolicibacterium litorale]